MLSRAYSMPPPSIISPAAHDSSIVRHRGGYKAEYDTASPNDTASPLTFEQALARRECCAVAAAQALKRLVEQGDVLVSCVTQVGLTDTEYWCREALTVRAWVKERQMQEKGVAA